MASVVISFRFSEQEVETLQKKSLEGESISQTARRVLRQVIEPDLHPRVNSNVDKRLQELEKRIESLEEQLASVGK